MSGHGDPIPKNVTQGPGRCMAWRMCPATSRFPIDRWMPGALSVCETGSPGLLEGSGRADTARRCAAFGPSWPTQWRR